MNYKLGVVMDPIGAINPRKDSTLAMLLDARARGWTLHYMEMDDLYVLDGVAHASMRSLEVTDSTTDWFTLGDSSDRPLGDLDIVLMRKDPPVDLEFISATYILERAEAEGVLVSNRPRALRDVNEKVCTAWFPQCCPATLFTRSQDRLRAFLAEHGSMVLKRVDAMGGRSIFVIHPDEPNTNVILEEMTRRGTRHVIAQAYLAAVTDSGDKRILLIDGDPVPEAVTRMPGPDDFRANLATGATPHPAALTERDRWICAEIGPTLEAWGVHFAGIDVIGGHLTEINVTSPTCIREIDRFHGVDIAARLMDALEARRTRE
ncbi:MAG: glutathione synthase [Gemmatimonadales bacterium]|nr:MAG: glutathione synthase [Gemmatimonadales bacterium]